MRRPSDSISQTASDVALRGVLAGLKGLPYPQRVRAMGRISQTAIAPLLGWTNRIRANLQHVRPDLSDAEWAHLIRQVPNNIGRTLIEIYSAPDFTAHLKGTPLQGPGLTALSKAVADHRPVILVSAHLGNFDAIRAVLNHHGISIGGLYRPLRNQAINAHYAAALRNVALPMFTTEPRGIAGFVRYLRQGNVVGMLTDVFATPSPDVTFFGQPAPTSGAAAMWAAKYDAVLIPAYGIRQENGLDFDVWLDPPIARGSVQAMTQAVNDAHESKVRAHMDQWFWVHRRWKPDHPATHAIDAARARQSASPV